MRSLFLVALIASGCDNKPKFKLDERFFKALAQMESGGDTHAIGDSGRAVGIFQIWKVYVDDCNRIIGYKKWAYSDRTNPEKSWAMVKLYIGYYCRSGRLGHEPTVEDAARIHNAGPNGYKKACSIPYAQKFMKIYKQM